MKNGLILVFLMGTLSACGGRGTDNLPVRDGPQAQDPYVISPPA